MINFLINLSISLIIIMLKNELFQVKDKVITFIY
jgi:hypothetical protein